MVLTGRKLPPEKFLWKNNESKQREYRLYPHVKTLIFKRRTVLPCVQSFIFPLKTENSTVTPIPVKIRKHDHMVSGSKINYGLNISSAFLLFIMY